MLEPGRRGGLQALLFRHAFWGMDISQFVRGAARGLPGWFGMVLWSLSAVGAEFRSVASLTALCTVRDDTSPAAVGKMAAMMSSRRILDPLRWFGLLECRAEDVPARVQWRKTVLFDRFLSFDVRLAEPLPDGRRRGSGEAVPSSGPTR